jgi:hypothetical protein
VGSVGSISTVVSDVRGRGLAVLYRPSLEFQQIDRRGKSRDIAQEGLASQFSAMFVLLQTMVKAPTRRFPEDSMW